MTKNSDSGYAYNAFAFCMCLVHTCRASSQKSVIAIDRFAMDYLAPIIASNVGDREKGRTLEEIERVAKNGEKRQREKRQREKRKTERRTRERRKRKKQKKDRQIERKVAKTILYSPLTSRIKID